MVVATAPCHLYHIQTAIIGAGVIGLSVARALSGKGHEVLLFEQANSIGSGQSSRNSEVIHAGIYYDKNAMPLKSKLCVEGRRLLYEYCRERNVPHNQCGKLLVDGTPPSIDEPLPLYPSDAHFVGPWRVLSSPLGIDKAVFADAESKSSDNFILRVDGQVMGGPILDAQYQHKAAGGEWKMFRAIRKSGASSSSIAPPETQTRLRIRLLVPPAKERALVMEANWFNSPNMRIRSRLQRDFALHFRWRS